MTLGLAAFVAPYYIFSEIMNKTRLVDENGHRLGQFKVNFTLAEIIGHAVIWLLLAIVTLGLALVIYYYMVLRKVLDRTEIVHAAAGATRTASWTGARDQEPAAAPLPAPAPPPARRPAEPGTPPGVVRR